MGYIQRGQEDWLVCQQEEKNVHTRLKNLAVIWQRNVEEFSTHTGAESTMIHYHSMKIPKKKADWRAEGMIKPS